MVNVTKNKYLLVILLFVVVVSITFITNYKVKQNKYNAALNSIEQQKWEEANQLLNETHGYKESDSLNKYISARLEFSDQNKPELERYSNTSKILDDLLSNYNGTYEDEIRSFAVYVINITYSEKRYQEGVKCIDNGEHDKAHKLLFPLQEENYKNSRDLFYINWGLNEYKKWVVIGKQKDSYSGRTASIEFLKVDQSNYGNYQTQIKEAIYDLGEVYINVASENEKIEEFNSKYKTGDPPIGISKSEALTYYSWSRPIKINKTINAYGISEQYVYSGYKYLYFDNDVLISIQK